MITWVRVKKKNNLFVAKTRTEYVHNNIESELFILSNRQLRRDHWSSSQAATINQDTHGGRTYKKNNKKKLKKKIKKK